MRVEPIALVAAGSLLLASAATAQLPLPFEIDAVKRIVDVHLDWSHDPSVVTYRIFRSTGVAVPFTEIATVPAPPFDDVGAVPAASNPKLYIYYVEAENAAGKTPSLNVAFKINIDVPPSSSLVSPGVPVSLPYGFHLGQPGPTSARDLCLDNPELERIVRIRTCGEIVVHVCHVPFAGFDLEPGEGYLVAARTFDTTLDLVGAHDNQYSDNKTTTPTPLQLSACGGCPGGARPLISIPYHAYATTAEEVCAEVASTSAPLFAVERYDRTRDRRVRHLCGFAATDFSLTVGEALYLVIENDTSWAPTVY